MKISITGDHFWIINCRLFVPAGTDDIGNHVVHREGHYLSGLSPTLVLFHATFLFFEDSCLCFVNSLAFIYFFFVIVMRFKLPSISFSHPSKSHTRERESGWVKLDCILIGHILEDLQRTEKNASSSRTLPIRNSEFKKILCVFWFRVLEKKIRALKQSIFMQTNPSFGIREDGVPRAIIFRWGEPPANIVQPN